MRVATFCSTAVFSPRSASPVPPPPSTKPSSPLYKISTAAVGQEFWFAVNRSVTSLVSHYFVCLYVCVCVCVGMLVLCSQTTSSPVCKMEQRKQSGNTRLCACVEQICCLLCLCVDCVCVPHNTPTVSHVQYVRIFLHRPMHTGSLEKPSSTLQPHQHILEVSKGFCTGGACFCIVVYSMATKWWGKCISTGYVHTVSIY